MRKGSSPHTPEDDFAARFAATALAAAAPVMEIYSRGAVARLKPDLSPVTEADEASERIILADLAREAPDIPVVSEEAVARGDCPDIGREFILVDPLDGTREFVNGNGEFTINIALVRDGAPVCGVMRA